MNFFKHSIFDHFTTSLSKHKKSIIYSSISLIVLVLLAVGGFFGYEFAFSERIYPNVYVGNIPVGGLTEAEAKAELEKQYNKMLDENLKVVLDGKVEQIDLQNSGATDPDLIYNLVEFDADRSASEAFSARRFPNPFDNILLKLSLERVIIDPQVTILEKQLTESIKTAFKEAEQPGQPTAFAITTKNKEIDVQVLEGVAGSMIDIQKALDFIYTDAQDLKLEPLQLNVETANRVITTNEASALISEVKTALSKAPFTFTYKNEAQREFTWTVDQNEIQKWFIPGRNESNQPVVALNPNAMKEWLDTVRTDIDVAPQNARFQVADGRVKEFKGSLNGVQLNDSQTILIVLEATKKIDNTVPTPVVVDTVEPEITTGSVNDLGIKEILGVGTSDFSGSPSNRIKNITHGADKLNGLLIPPGESLSLVEHLKPFTIEDGYFPELVIKGDEIKPEVGGGLCQIGTTTFRAVMNSGLQVDQRRNHSLVVSYYDDPSNGNPGTDATIYDPAPDFKFSNDTENYILLTTEVDLPNRQLIFTLWGTSDGRKGYYTPPQVVSWSGFGATQYKETDSLAPGVEKCQAPHAGATTTFDYIVEFADGTKFEKTYDSVYRSLPRICLVGKSTTPSPSAEINTTGDASAPAVSAIDELKVNDVVPTP